MKANNYQIISKANFQLIFGFLLFTIVICCQSEIANPSEKQETVQGNSIDDFRRALISQQFDSVFSKYAFNGGISVEQNGHKIYERFQGFENFKTKKSLDSNSVFAIGSVSKQFTAALILVLEEKGKLGTADRISKYLPEYRSRTFEEITIHHLLTHTSGISDLGPGVQSKAGTDFNYSNKGYRMLGEIVEAASGKSYDENARDLLAKTGLTNTFTAENFTGKNLAGAHTGTFNNVTAVENMPRRLVHSSISTAAGGILSTVADLHRWNAALHNGKVLQPNSLKKFVTQTSMMKHPVIGQVGYGYGIMLSERPKSYLHTGYVKGSPTFLIYYPQSKTSMVVVSNIADTSKTKSAIFKPHTEAKIITDAIENALIEMEKRD